MKNITSIISITNLLILAACSGSSGGSGKKSNNNSASSSYTQVERLARPAVNEALVLSNDNLNSFNSIPPSSDLDSSNPAVAAVLNEAVAVLTVVRNLGLNAGLTPPETKDVAAQFLPDMLRISIDDSHYGALHELNPNDSRTGDSAQNEVGYTSCVSLTAGAPLLCGGRKIRDDVIDITLSYIAGGAEYAAPGSAAFEGDPDEVPAYLVSD